MECCEMYINNSFKTARYSERDDEKKLRENVIILEASTSCRWKADTWSCLILQWQLDFKFDKI